MRKVLVSLAVLALIASPVLAAGFAKVIIPAQPTRPGAYDRPNVDIDTVIGPVIGWAANPSNGFNGGFRYDVSTGTLNLNQAYIPAVVEPPTPAQKSLATGFSPWADECGISDNWAVYGGPPSNQAPANPILVQNLATGALTALALSPTADDTWHMTDVNDAGDVLWVGWVGTNETLYHANVSNPSVITPVAVVPGQSGGTRPAISTDNDIAAWRKDTGTIGGVAYGSGAKTIGVYDLSAGTEKNWVSNGDQKIYHMGIEDGGNWMVSNVRSIAAGGFGSDINLVNLQGASLVATDLHNGGYQYERNDPEMEVIDADKAIVVWDEFVNGHYRIVGVVVSGLSTGTISKGTEFLINSSTTDDLRYADIDGNLVAWKNMTTGAIEYAYIPEPATLALVGLGVLALARRR